MANQPETPVYSAGIYQFETTDVVEGGVGGIDNRPLLELANRTAWLKLQADSNWRVGDVKEVDCNNTYIAANFDGTGLGKNERLGWAICNGQNGTKDRSERTSIGYGGSFTIMGATGGSKDAVVVQHSHVMNSHNHNVAKIDFNNGGAKLSVGSNLAMSTSAANLNSDAFDYELGASGGGAANAGKTDLVASTMQNSGVPGTGKNMQPYIVTLFIQKI